jgi:HlyD family secretion protein
VEANKVKKTYIWLLVVILIAGSIWAAFYFRNKNTTESGSEILRSANVTYGDLSQSVSASGNIIFNESTGLSFQSSGTVASISVKNGDFVHQDQVLALLDTDDLEWSRLQAVNALEQAKLNLRIASESVDEDTIELGQSALSSAAQALESARLGKLTSQSDASNLIVQAERDREAAYIKLRDASDANKESAQSVYNTAREQEAISRLNAQLLIEQAESQWWSAYVSFKQAERSLEKLQSPPDELTIAQLELQVTQAELNLEQEEQRLEDASLTAPFDGIITQVNLQKGVIPNTSLPAMKMIDKSAIYLEIAIDEIDIGKVSTGMSATVKLDAFPETPINGQVYDIAPSATNIGGIVSYKVRILISEYGDIDIREGMTASADILVDSISNVLLIPNWAIRTDQETNQTYCYKIVDGLPNQVIIELGVFGDAYSSVESGLTDGDVVGLISEERNLLDPDFRPGGRMRP